MRVTKENAELNRRRILEAASRLFKTQGIDNVSVADLMKAAGFTHGGFYNHFESKADLAAETVRFAFEQALGDIAKDDPASIGASDAMADRLAQYTSSEHRDDPGGGCPTGALPVDVGRQSVEAQRVFAEGLERYLDLIEGTEAGHVRTRGRAIVTLATLVGSIVLARAVREADHDLSSEILHAVRDLRHGRTGEPARSDRGLGDRVDPEDEG